MFARGGGQRPVEILSEAQEMRMRTKVSIFQRGLPEVPLRVSPLCSLLAFSSPKKVQPRTALPRQNGSCSAFVVEMSAMQGTILLLL